MIEPHIEIDEQAYFHLCDCSYKNHRQRTISAYIKDWRNHTSGPYACEYYKRGSRAMVANLANRARYEHAIGDAIIHLNLDEPEVLEWIKRRTRSYGDLTQWFDYLLATIAARVNA